MYPTNHRFTYYFTFLLLGSISYTSLLSHTTTLPDNTAFIEKTGNTKLRKALQRLEKGKELKNHTLTELLKMGMEEGDKMALLITIYLVKICRKRKLPIKKDAVMRHAIQHNASIELITYLFENKIYSKRSLAGEARYDLTLKFPLLRIIENEVFTQQIIPKSISSFIGIISQLCLLLRILAFFNMYKITPRVKRWEYIGILLKPIELIINLLVLIYYTLYRIGIKPGYLILALLSKRSKPEKEKLALLLLQYGADPNGKCLIIEYLPSKSEKPEEKAYFEHNKPIYARRFYAIHLAIKYDLLACVKELERRGADLNPLAVYMGDEVDFTTNPPKKKLIRIREIHCKKSKNAQYKRSLDFAKANSNTREYLLKKGLVPTKKLKEEK